MSRRQRTTKTKKCDRVESLTLDLPENLDIDELLATHPPISPHVKRDHLVYICHIIIEVASRRKDVDIEENDGFTPINKAVLQSRVRNYRPNIEYLCAVGVIEEKPHYKRGKQSGGLRFTERYQGWIKPVTITNWPLIKSILHLEDQGRLRAKQEVPYLVKWWNEKLQIDREGALNRIRELYEQECTDPKVKFPGRRVNRRLIHIERISRQDFQFIVDSKAGRLHTLLTQMKSDLRRFLRYDGEPLWSIDIRNSQPYFATALFEPKSYEKNNMEGRIIRYNEKKAKAIENKNITTNIDHMETEHTNTTYPPVPPDYVHNSTYMIVNFISNYLNKPDVLKFKDWVIAGCFYEKFGAIMKANHTGEWEEGMNFRESAKIGTFKALFARNSAIGSIKVMRAFRESFPNVYDVFKFVKQGKDQHPTLALTLQSLEADLVLKKICGRIADERPDIPLFTLHDSVITTEKHVGYVRSVMSHVLEEWMGASPALKIESWA